MAASLAEVSDTVAATTTKRARQSRRNLDILSMARGMTGKGDLGSAGDGGDEGGFGEEVRRVFCHMLADYPDSVAAKVGFRLKNGGNSVNILRVLMVSFIERGNCRSFLNHYEVQYLICEITL